MIAFIAVMAVLTAGGCYLTERVDRPRRRAEQAAQIVPAE
jgi:hypothetical protein